MWPGRRPFHRPGHSHAGLQDVVSGRIELLPQDIVGIEVGKLPTQHGPAATSWFAARGTRTVAGRRITTAAATLWTLTVVVALNESKVMIIFQYRNQQPCLSLVQVLLGLLEQD